MNGAPLAPLSAAARNFLRVTLMREWRQRPSAEEALKDPWAVGGGRRGGTAVAAATPGPTPVPTPAFHVEWDDE